MRKFIYNSIVDKLKEQTNAEDKPIIKHFDLWNNNIEYIDEEQAFYTPAVFVEFQPIEWRHLPGGVREAAINVVLHVITQRNMPTSGELQYAETSLDFFDLLTGINKTLHCHAKVSDTFIHDSLLSVLSATDNDCGELRHDVETFCCHITDMSAKSEMRKTTATLQFEN